MWYKACLCHVSAPVSALHWWDPHRPKQRSLPAVSTTVLLPHAHHFILPWQIGQQAPGRVICRLHVSVGHWSGWQVTCPPFWHVHKRQSPVIHDRPALNSPTLDLQVTAKREKKCTLKKVKRSNSCRLWFIATLLINNVKSQQGRFLKRPVVRESVKRGLSIE